MWWSSLLPPRTPGKRHPGAGELQMVGKRPSSQGTPKSTPRICRKGNSTLEQQWAGQSAFLPVSTGILHLPESLGSKRGVPTPLVVGNPAPLPGAPSLDTPQCTQVLMFFQPPHLLQAALYRGGTLSSSNTKTYFSTDSVCAKEL